MHRLTRPRRRERRDERGSALLLVPTGVLVMIVLGALMVDTAAAFLAEREAESTAAALANDLATLAVDETALRLSGAYVISGARIDALKPTIQATAETQLSEVFVDGSVVVDVRILGFDRVEVTVSGAARRIIGPFGWSGFSRTYAVSATEVGHVHLSG